MCPNCCQITTFTFCSANHVETHGLDCGPYERWTDEWLECNRCGARTDELEIAAMADYEADAYSLFDTEPAERPLVTWEPHRRPPVDLPRKLRKLRIFASHLRSLR